MHRRTLHAFGLSLLGSLILSAHGRAQALLLAELSNTDVARGLKTALERSAQAAVSSLGKTDGFLGNEKVRIPFPAALNQAAELLRNIGQGQKLDELKTAMNRAAEAAVPLAASLLVDSVRSMSFSDAKRILNGGDTAATRFFAEKTRTSLEQKFLPVVTRTTEKVGLAEKYNHIAGQAADLGLMRREDASIQHHVTGKALDGLYLMIAEEEQKIRQDPAGTGSALLNKVFRTLK